MAKGVDPLVIKSGFDTRLLGHKGDHFIFVKGAHDE